MVQCKCIGWPRWSIVIGVLATAVSITLSIKKGSNLHGSKTRKCKKQTHKKSNKKLFVRWKGINDMTMVFAAFMVSKGISGRGSSMVCG